MNRDDIIRMAREAGLEVGDVEDEITFEITTEIFCRDYDYYQDNPDIGYLVQTDDLLRFAHLVYESVFRDANIAASRTILDAAVLEEREACAKVCESVMPNPVKNWSDAQIVNALRDCAAAIRARSNP
jgi:hypothetical protein